MKNKPICIPEDYKIINDKNSLIIGFSKYGNIGLKIEEEFNDSEIKYFPDLRMLILGQAGCGKTELCKTIAIKLHLIDNLPTPIVIDCNGEYKKLNELNLDDSKKDTFRVISYTDFENLEEILADSLILKISTIIDLESLPQEEQQKIGIKICKIAIDHNNWLSGSKPALFIWDTITELQHKSTPIRSELGKEFIDTFKYFISMARMRNHGYILVAQRFGIGKIHGDITSSINSYLFGKSVNDFDLKRISEISNRSINIDQLKQLKYEFITFGQYSFDHDSKYPIKFGFV